MGRMGEKFDYARRLIERHTREGERASDYSTMRVGYGQKHQGRRVARGPRLNGLSRSLRKIALKSQAGIEGSFGEQFENCDVDASNAFMQFLWNELYGVVGDGANSEYETFMAL